MGHYENLTMQYNFFQLLKIENSNEKTDTFNIIVQNIHCGYTLEPPRRGGSNEYPQCMFWIKITNNMYAPKYHSSAI